MNWLWSIALKKGVSRVVQLTVAWLAAQGLGQFGITIEVEKLTAGLFGALEVFRNWLKVKKGIKWL